MSDDLSSLESLFPGDSFVRMYLECASEIKCDGHVPKKEKRGRPFRLSNKQRKNHMLHTSEKKVTASSCINVGNENSVGTDLRSFCGS